MSRLSVVLLSVICVVFLAAPALAGGSQASAVVIPPLDVDGQFAFYWLEALLQGSQTDLHSRYGTGGPPEGAGKPVLKSRWGADDPPQGANKPVLKSKYGADDPPKGANKPVLKSRWGADDPPKGANKPT